MEDRNREKINKAIKENSELISKIRQLAIERNKLSIFSRTKKKEISEEIRQHKKELAKLLNDNEDR
jgi:hypothetical protein